jgi:hypothetical protein
MEKTLILGECKWSLSENERKVMAELVEEKAAKVIPAQGKWKVYFLGFSRSGWTSGALAYQEEIAITRFEEKTGRLRECRWSPWMNWMAIWFWGQNSQRRLQRRSQ